MTQGLNKWLGMGNLTEDPTLRYTQSGNAVLNMRIACNETYFDRDRNKKERVEFINVAVWGKRAEALSKFLRKGSSLLVEGSIRNSSYEGKDGQTRYKTEINAREIILTGGGGGARGDSRSPGPAADEPRVGFGDPGNFGGDPDDVPF